MKLDINKKYFMMSFRFDKTKSIHFGLIKSVRKDFIIRKEIIFDSYNEKEINKKEVEFIRMYESNNPTFGYNRWPEYNKQ